MGDKAKVCKLNVDQSPKIAQRFGVMSIPTALIFKGGKVVDKFVGVMPKQTIVDKLNAVILAKTGPANCGLGGSVVYVDWDSDMDDWVRALGACIQKLSGYDKMFAQSSNSA